MRFAAALAALSSGACTAMYAGTASLTTDHSGNLGARLTASHIVGVTRSEVGQTPSAVWGPPLYPFPIEVGVGIDFATGALSVLFSTSLGYTHHPRGDESVRAHLRIRYDGDDVSMGPAVEAAHLWDLRHRVREGRCPDEGARIFHSLGIAADGDVMFGGPAKRVNLAVGVRYQYTAYINDHPFTDCDRKSRKPER